MSDNRNRRSRAQPPGPGSMRAHRWILNLLRPEWLSAFLPRETARATSASTSRRKDHGVLLAAAALSICGTLALARASAAGVTITEPRLNETYNGVVSAVIDIGHPFDARHFHVELNGVDVTKQFGPVCTGATTCQQRAHLPAADLMSGTNVLVADAGGPNQSVATARVKFEYDTALTANAPVEKLIPAVAVQAVSLRNWSENYQDPGNYEIILGPGPNFAVRSYPAQRLGCPAGINSMQVLALTRKTLVPDTRVGGTGEACLADAAAVTSFFKAIPKGDIVIAHTFMGLMQNLDATAIGGTDFTKISSKPWYYNVIGVAGAPADTAYESYQPIHQLGQPYISRLFGSLMLDLHQNYFFKPSDYRTFKVIPNDAARRTSTIIIGDTSYAKTLPADASGGVRVLQLDRRMGYIQYDHLYATNQTDPGRAAEEIDALYDVLRETTPEYLMFIASVGTPFASADRVPARYFDVINALGGNPYLLKQLVPQNGAQEYALITATDPQYVKAGSATQNYSAWNEPSTAALYGVLARDRANRYYVETSLTDLPEVGGVKSEVSWEWERVGFQMPQDWPAWTPAQKSAYEDLPKYPAIQDRLGCSSCQPIRAYYDGAVGGTGGGDLNVLKINWQTLAYQPNANYTQDDFHFVTQQLRQEQGYLNNVYTLYSMFRALTYESNDNLAFQLTKVSKQIDSSLNAPKYDPPITVADLRTAAAVTTLLARLPYVGNAFAAVTCVLSVTAFVKEKPGSDVPDGKYAVTLSELSNGSLMFATNLANSTDILFTGITNDWGKLRTIGGGYGNHEGPWYMCQSCANQPPRTALPAVALGAKRRFYSELMGKTYSLDTIKELPAGRVENPRRFGSPVAVTIGQPICHFSYARIGSGWLRYESFNNPANVDMFMVTQTAMGKERIGGKDVPILYFPSSNLEQDLFGKPTLADGLLAGGAGFSMDQFIYSDAWNATPNRALTLRPAYQIPNVGICFLPIS